MSCFDTVKFSCPTCTTAILIQTKSGPCALKTYRGSRAPLSVAGGVLGETVSCPKCSASWKITGPRVIQLGLEPLDEDDDCEDYD